MTVFESRTTVKKTVNEVYNFLSDLNNHRQLMPADIQNWVSTPDTASFEIQNMVKLSLKTESRIADNEIVIIAVDDQPFKLGIKWVLAVNDDQTDVLLTISANLNIMLKIVASGPLQKLAEQETNNLSSLLS